MCTVYTWVVDIIIHGVTYSLIPKRRNIQFFAVLIIQNELSCKCTCMVFFGMKKKNRSNLYLLKKLCL